MELTPPAMLEATYDLAGHHLRVTAPDAALLGATEDVLGLCRTTTAGEVGFTLVLAYGEPAAVPDGAPRLWDGPLPEGPHGTIADDGDALYLCAPGCSGLIVDRAARRAEVTAVPGRAAYAGATPAMLAIESALAAGGQTLLHAACLLTPDGGGTILVMAPSGTGKTTTALALAAQGWALMTDDTAVLMRSGGVPVAWGLPRPLTVHRHTAALMPWLEPALGRWNSEDEQPVALSALPTPARAAERRPLPVRATILLAPRGTGPTRIGPLARSEALVRLSTDNVGLSSVGLTLEAKKRFAALGDLVTAAPVLELDVGRGALDRVGALLAAALAAR
jgi:hypothetical protein